MPESNCENCGHSFSWRWEEAFDKFGFKDGDGQVETWQVTQALEDSGYEVREWTWGCHNTIIVSIKKDGVEQIPSCVKVGYDNPREHLPAAIITILDEEFEV